jgi:hypothetical protein
VHSSQHSSPHETFGVFPYPPIVHDFSYFRPSNTSRLLDSRSGRNLSRRRLGALNDNFCCILRVCRGDLRAFRSETLV